MLALFSLALSVVGIFTLRLWLLGWVVGVVALVMGLVWVNRESVRGEFPRMAVALSSAATVLPLIIAGVTFAGAVSNYLDRPERVRQNVEFLVEADANFRVTHTVPAEPGQDVLGLLRTEESNDYSYSFETDIGTVQFIAGILPSSLGVQEITCSIKIDGNVVLTRTSDRRYVDCSANLQELSH